MNGFGWSFYGFFGAAVAFVSAYLVWARIAAARDARRRRESS